MINLGDKVKDTVTGFVGIAIARTTFLHGCARIGVKAQIKKGDKKPEDAQWFDEPQLKLVKAKVVNVDKKRSTGGPMHERPRKNETPRA